MTESETRIQNSESARRPPRKRGGAWRVVFVAALIVLVCAIGALGFLAYNYWAGQQIYDKLEDAVQTDFSDACTLADFQVDWDALRAINPDIVGWIYIPNTNINYPIVQASDNSYYLSHDFEGTDGSLVWRGTPFLDYENKADFTDDVNFVYAHHLNDDTMFSAIASLDDQSRFDECRTVYLLTPTMNYKLRSFSLVHCAGSEEIVQLSFGTTESFNAYVQDKIDRSVVTVSDCPAASSIEQVFAFSTCDNYLNSDGRFILFCSAQEQVPMGVSASESFVSGEDAAEANSAAAEKTS